MEESDSYDHLESAASQGYGIPVILRKHLDAPEQVRAVFWL